MEKLYFLIFTLLIVMIGCSDNGTSVQPPPNNNNSEFQAPSKLTNIQAIADTGSVILKWGLPGDGSITYVKVSTKKYPDKASSKIVSTRVSTNTESVMVTGLLHKYRYTFKLQAFNVDSTSKKSGKVYKTDPIQPNRRSIKVIQKETPISIDSTMISAKTHTDARKSSSSYITEIDKAKNLLDDNKATYWQSAWNRKAHDPPFYIYINLPKKVALVSMKYYVRQRKNDLRGYPDKFGISTSMTGNTWTQAWKSKGNLPVTPISKHFEISFNKKITGKNFRFEILSVHDDSATFACLAELSLYKQIKQQTDLEQNAENNYSKNDFIKFK